MVGSLIASRSHLLQRWRGGLSPVQNFNIGDALHHVDYGAVEIRSAVLDRRRGLYNPHTISGTIVVDGIVASCYTTFMNPLLAHSLLAPLRLIFRTFGQGVSFGATPQGTYREPRMPSASRTG